MLFLDGFLEFLRGLEVRDVRLGDHYRGLLGDVTGRLGCAVLDAEGAEAPQVYGFALDEGALDGFHDALNGGGEGRLLNACGLRHGAHKISFSHSTISFGSS